MIAQEASQVRKMVGIQTGSQRMALMRVMLGLALCVLIGGMAPTAAAWRANDSTPPQRVYALQTDGIWVSDDAGISWTQAGALPSRPLAIAASQETPGLVFVGTESLGLVRSNDGGASWQPVDTAVLAKGQAASVAVTALAIDPEDEQIVYAATNIWLGTNPAHLIPFGVAVSVDGGRQWLQLSRAQLGDTPLQRLEPVTGQPLSVVTFNSTGSNTVSLKMSPELLGLLQDGDPAVRASAARAIGLIGDLIGDPVALPSRPLAIAVAQGTPGLVFVGTESDGLLRSNDGGASWQPVDTAVLAKGQAASVAVTALAIDPEDEQIVYAATNIWLGTNPAHLIPFGVAVSVDGGRQWLQLSRAQLGDTPLQRLEPVTGQPLSVVTFNSTGSNTVSLKMSPELLGLLQDGDPAVRASAARAIGLIGDAAALPGLMQALADTDALAGQRIAEAIGRIGDRSISADLLTVLGSAPPAERARAALALGLLKSEEAVPGLAALLSAGDPEAQRVAAEALAAIGTPAAMAALMAPLADPQMTSARHAAMGGLEAAGQSAVAPLAAALHDGNAVVRANAAEMLGWLKSADAVAGLARLLSDPDPAVQAQAAWALGEINTGPARLALIPAPILAPVARPVAAAPLIALPGAIAAVPANFGTLAAVAALSVLAMLAMLAIVLIWKGPRPASHLGPA